MKTTSQNSCHQNIKKCSEDPAVSCRLVYKYAKDQRKQHQPVQNGLLEELHAVPVGLGFKV